MQWESVVVNDADKRGTVIIRILRMIQSNVRNSNLS